MKGFASVELPWYGLLAATNWNLNEGNVRSESITGPGTIANCPAGTPNAACAPGTNGTVKYTTLAFQPNGSNRLPAVNLIDVSVSKNFDFGRQKLTVTFNCFNILNINTIQGFSSNNASNNGQTVGGVTASSTFLAINSIVPPRVFRIDLRYAF